MTESHGTAGGRPDRTPGSSIRRLKNRITPGLAAAMTAALCVALVAGLLLQRELSDTGGTDIGPLLEALRHGNEAEKRSAKDVLNKTVPLPANIDHLIALLDEGDDDLRVPAIRALSNMGPDAAAAVPKLSALLLSRQRSIARSTIEALAKIGPAALPAIREILRHTLATGAQDRQASRLQGNALRVLAKMGPAARPALPQVLEVFQRGPDSAAVEALVAIGEPAQAPALELLTQGAAPVRPAAAKVLGKIGKPTEAVVDALAKALSSQDRRLRRTALVALGNFGSAARKAVPALAGIAGNGNDRLQVEAVEVLSRLMEHAAQARPQLVLLLENENPAIRAQAALSLGALDPDPKTELQTLIRLLDDPYRKVRQAAAKAIGRAGPAAAAAVPALTAKVQEPSGDMAIHEHAIRALLTLGKSSKPGLLAALNHDDLRIRRGTLKILAGAPSAGESILPELERHLKSASPRLTRDIISVLQKIGAAAMPALLRATGLEDSEAKRAAWQALRQLGRKHPAGLVDALRASSAAERAAAIQAVGNLPRPPASALPLLIRVMDDVDPSVRRAAQKAVKRFRDLPENLIPDLVVLLDHPGPTGRAFAASRLGGFGPAAEEAVPRLIEALQSGDKPLRQVSRRALAGIGASAVMPLIALLNHKELAVRRAAADSLGFMGPAAAAALPKLRRLIAAEGSDSHYEFAIAEIEGR